MDNNNQPIDDLSQAGQDAEQKISDAAGGVGDIGDKLGQTLEDGLQNAEQKLDDLMSGLDNFLGKF